MVKIRLKRLGAKKRPYFRVVVADSRQPRGGRGIEEIGKYHPLVNPSVIEIDEERALHWLKNGAQPTEPAEQLLRRVGIWEKFTGKPEPPAKPQKPKKTKKAKAAAEAAAKAAATEAAAPAEKPEPQETPAAEAETAPAAETEAPPDASPEPEAPSPEAPPEEGS